MPKSAPSVQPRQLYVVHWGGTFGRARPWCLGSICHGEHKTHNQGVAASLITSIATIITANTEDLWEIRRFGRPESGLKWVEHG